jgi:hypothetical protein
MERTPQVSLYERKITLLSQQMQTHQYNEPPADTFITNMCSSATRQRSVTALKRPISLVGFFHHCSYSAILYTNKKNSFIHVGHCENLSWVSSQISFSLSPGFKFTGRYLIQLISGSAMAEEELPSGWEKRLSRSTGVFLKLIVLLWNYYCTKFHRDKLLYLFS